MIAEAAWKSALLHKGQDVADLLEIFDADAYGRCPLCGVDLDRTALQQQPWLSTCSVHAGRWIS